MVEEESSAPAPAPAGGATPPPPLPSRAAAPPPSTEHEQEVEAAPAPESAGLAASSSSNPLLGRKWLAGCSYVPPEDSNDKLAFEEGEVLLVLSELQGGWWFAAKGDQRGWIPSDFMDPLPEGEEEEEEEEEDEEADDNYDPAEDFGPGARTGGGQGADEDDDAVSQALAAVSNAEAMLARLNVSTEKNDRARSGGSSLESEPVLTTTGAVGAGSAASPAAQFAPYALENAAGSLPQVATVQADSAPAETNGSPVLPPRNPNYEYNRPTNAARLPGQSSNSSLNGSTRGNPSNNQQVQRMFYEDMSDATPINLVKAADVERRISMSRTSSQSSNYMAMSLHLGENLRTMSLEGVPAADDDVLTS